MTIRQAQATIEQVRTGTASTRSTRWPRGPSWLAWRLVPDGPARPNDAASVQGAAERPAVDFLLNLLAALLAGQLEYMAAHRPAPSSGPQQLCGDGLVKPVHIMPADKWVCPPIDEPAAETSPE